MPVASANWKTKCANLAERRIVKGKQSHKVYRETTEKRERGQNTAADCKAQIPPDDDTAGNETAAPAGPRNGGNTSEKHSSAFGENGYHNGELTATRAGHWYAENREACPRPIIPTLRRMFGLSALEAVQAIREANGGGR